MPQNERRILCEKFVHTKIEEDPLFTPELAVMLFNWNTDHPEDIIEDSLLSEVKTMVLEKEGDVGKLVSHNKGTRDQELARIFGRDYFKKISKDGFLKGFWKMYAVNILKGDKSIAEIRAENYSKNLNHPAQIKKRNEKKKRTVEEIAKLRYPQFGYLSKEAQRDIIEEIERGG